MEYLTLETYIQLFKILKVTQMIYLIFVTACTYIEKASQSCFT